VGGSFNLRSTAVNMTIVREDNVFDQLKDFFANVIDGDKEEQILASVR